MTLTELCEAVASDLGDPGFKKYPRALIVSRINIAQLKVARELQPKSLMNYAEISSWTVGTREMLIAGTNSGTPTGFGITDFLIEQCLLWDGYELPLRSIEEYDEHSTGNHDPDFYYIRGVYVGLGDRPPASAKTVRLDYIKKPLTLVLSSQETLDLDSVYHYLVELETTFMISHDPYWKPLINEELENLRFFSVSSKDSYEIRPNV